ncbi:MAG TPA: hypothetical protein VNH18_08650 [Bryobacteraceae bacterium]|nr:hypothetical protein [Bryobacteraceae bacterium]
MNADENVTAPAEGSVPGGKGATEASSTDPVARADAARGRAAQLIAERRYAEAKVAIDEAQAIEFPTAVKDSRQNLPDRVMSAVRHQLRRLPNAFKLAGTLSPEAELAAMAPEDRAVAILGLYSKVAAVAGLVPGGLLNFAAILAVQVIMVWRIADTFGHRENKNRIRGVILALLGSAVPTSLGAGVMIGIRSLAVRSVPTLVAGTLAGFVVTPVFAYAMTKAVGSVFVMHFQSGGTLLTFDPDAFRKYFVKEFQDAGGTLAVPATN